jgi:hypothetical protein
MNVMYGSCAIGDVRLCIDYTYAFAICTCIYTASVFVRTPSARSESKQLIRCICSVD